MAHKLRIPAARCPACGHVTRDFELIDRRCERMLEGARCRCGGDGWIYARAAHQ